MRRRGAALAGVVLALLVPLAACSGGDDDQQATGERPDLPTTPPDLWNPCDGLRPAEVNRIFGTTFTARTGTATEPLCQFAPTTEGEPVVDINYQLYPGTLDDLIGTFGDLATGSDTQVTDPTVPDADDAKIVTDVDDDDTLAVTGFVRNGRLVQVVNVIDPTPFRRAAVLKAVEAVMADLATHAEESGVDDDDPGGASPSDAPTS